MIIDQRLLATLKRLRMEQWFYRLKYFFKRRLYAKFPHHALRSIQRRIKPGRWSWTSADWQGFIDYRMALDTGEAGRSQEDFLKGCFQWAGKRHEFGHWDQVDWLYDLQEGNLRLWRMTLGYARWVYLLCLSLRKDRDAARRVWRQTLISWMEESDWARRNVFRDQWNSYCLAHRLINYLTAARILSIDLNEEPDDVRLALMTQAQFLIENLEKEIGANHLWKDAVALLVFGCSGEGGLFSRAYKVGWRLLKRELREQVTSDGMHYERSPMYHGLFLQDVIDLSILLPNSNLKSSLMVLRAKMLGVMSAMTHGDGKIAMLHDSWVDEGSTVQGLCEALDASIPDEPVGSFQWLGDSGIAVANVKTAYGPSKLIVDAGKESPWYCPGHTHASQLAFEYSIGGERLFVDTGVAAYSRGELRDSCRSACSHNASHPPGREPIECWDSFRVARGCKLMGSGTNGSAGFKVDLDASRAGGFRGTRHWMLGKDPGFVWELQEEWGTRFGCIESHFIVADGWLIEALSDRSVKFINKTMALEMRLLSDCDNIIGPEIEKWPYYLEFGKPRSGSRMTWTFRQERGPISMRWELLSTESL